jgi:hypothetical protein
MCSPIICLGGHYDPAPPRQYKRPPQKGYDPNDGRAPDTDMALHPQGIQDAVTRNSFYLQSYRWHINSCFLITLWKPGFVLFLAGHKTSSNPSASFSHLMTHSSQLFLGTSTDG